MQILWDSNSASGLLLPAFLAVWFLLATIRTLPAIIYKIESLLPGRTHRMRFVKRDSTTPVMFLLTMASLGMMAWATSPWFAMQFGSYVLVNMLGWMALRGPTADGRALLEQLSEFRMFLADVDSDRLNRMNAPNATSANAEKYWGWALALDIEHTWGEQFAAAVLNQLGPGSAMLSIEANCPEERRSVARRLTRGVSAVDIHDLPGAKIGRRRQQIDRHPDQIFHLAEPAERNAR